MDLSTSDRLKALLPVAERFLEEHAYPLEPEVAKRGFAACLPELARARDEVKKLGLFAPQIPKEHGGVGLSFLEHTRLSELLGRSFLGHYLFNCQAPDAGNMEVLMQFGSDAQKARWLGPLVRGEIRSCFSMTEPDRAGSNPTWLDTRAVREGDEYVITGKKWFTTAADGAAFAIVMAVTNPDAPAHMRASQILVPTDTPGFELVRNISVMGHVGDDWASHAEVAYNGCRVPASNLIGQEGAGFLIAQERLGPGRIHHCMRWIGIAERSFDLMCKRAATRELSPGKPLGTKQIVQTWVAESRAEIDAARLLVQRAAWTIDKHGGHAAREEISIVKFFAAKVLEDVVDRAIQVHGALGLTDDLPLSMFYRAERAARVYDGPDEVHKTVVARRILKKYGLVVPGSEGLPMSVLDESRDPRAGEELPVEALAAYLKAAAGIDGPLRVTQFPSGHSNLTYLVEAGDRQLVLRRPPFGSKVKTAHDMGREHRILTALSGVYPCPKPVAYCEDESVMGARFYLMERIRGVIVRKDLPKGMTLSPEDVGKLDTELVDKLADLHAIDANAVGLGDLGKPEGYVERQVTGWTKRYEGSKTDDVAAVDAIAKWLAERIPKESGATLIHNDYKLDNVVLAPDAPTKIIGVLDWEMSTLGDPLMDLGTALSYWLEPGDNEMMQMIRWAPTTLPGSLTRRQLADRYGERTGRDVSNAVYYYCFGLFKTAVVLQQIYYRYKQGLTKDARFAQLGMAVAVLSNAAVEAAEANRL